ncbi:MAG: helix-turn-helix domain containing protein, partial [Actinomycetota bacterium]|nr:helix-turn-helix domain containing protein [Actinomycetota bacterium]
MDRALRSAALRLVSARGLHDITVEDIAKAAGVSKRTFSNHFSCNEDALVGPGRELGEHIADELARRPAQESTLDALHAVLGETVAAAERSPQRLADRAARIQLVRTYRDVLLPRQLAAIADL